MTPIIWKRGLAVVAVVLMGFALSRLDANALRDSVLQIPPLVIFALVALQIASQLLVNLQWYAIAKTAGLRVSFWQMLYANCKGSVIDAITPGVKFGGEVARAVEIKRVANCNTDDAAAAVAMQKIFSVSAMMVVAAIVSGGIFPAARIVFLLLLLVFALFFFAAAKIKTRLAASFQNEPVSDTNHFTSADAKKRPLNFLLRKLRGFIIALCGQIETLRASKKSAPVFALSLGIWILYPAKMYILAAQFGLGFFYAAAIVFSAYLVAMLPIFPGGLGGFEATMTGLLAAAGIAVADAAVVTVFFRFVTFWFVMLASAAYVGVFSRIKSCIR